MGKLATLCESCRKAVPQLCQFIQCDDPAAALLAVGAEAETKLTTNGTLYWVTTCPMFEAGELPPLTGAMSPQGYSLVNDES